MEENNKKLEDIEVNTESDNNEDDLYAAFDSLDMEDPFSEPTDELSDDPANPVDKVLRSVKKVIHEDLSFEKVGELVGDKFIDSLPGVVREPILAVKDTADELIEKAQGPLNQVKKNLKNTLGSIENAAPEALGIKKLVSKIKNSIHVDEEDNSNFFFNVEKTVEEIARENAEKAYEEIKSKAEEELKNATLEYYINKPQRELQAQTVTELTKLRIFATKITNAYYKKSLELQFRHLLTTEKLYKFIKTDMEAKAKQLEAIVRNTALPDIVKTNTKEYLKELARQKAAQKGIDIIKSSGTFQKLITNIKTTGENLITQTAAKFSGGTAVGDMLAAAREAGSNPIDMLMSMLMDQAVAAATAPVTEAAKRKFMSTKAGNKLSELIAEVGTDPKAILEALKEKYEKEEQEYASKELVGVNLSTKLKNVKNKIGEKKAGLAKNIFDILANSVESSNDLSIKFAHKDPDAPTHINFKTIKAITEVIPNLLSKILAEITSIRIKLKAPTPASELVYDYNKEKFVSTKDLKKELQRYILDTGKTLVSKEKYVGEKIAQLLHPYGKLKDEELAKFTKHVADYSKETGITDLRLLVKKGLLDKIEDEELKKKLAPILNAYENDTSYEKMERTESLINELKDLKTTRDSYIEAIARKAENIHKLGRGDVLDKLGLVDKDDYTTFKTGNVSDVLNKVVGKELIRGTKRGEYLNNVFDKIEEEKRKAEEEKQNSWFNRAKSKALKFINLSKKESDKIKKNVNEIYIAPYNPYAAKQHLINNEVNFDINKDKAFNKFLELKKDLVNNVKNTKFDKEAVESFFKVVNKKVEDISTKLNTNINKDIKEVKNKVITIVKETVEKTKKDLDEKIKNVSKTIEESAKKANEKIQISKDKASKAIKKAPERIETTVKNIKDTTKHKIESLPNEIKESNINKLIQPVKKQPIVGESKVEILKNVNKEDIKNNIENLKNEAKKITETAKGKIYETKSDIKDKVNKIKENIKNVNIKHFTKENKSEFLQNIKFQEHLPINNIVNKAADLKTLNPIPAINKLKLTETVSDSRNNFPKEKILSSKNNIKDTVSKVKDKLEVKKEDVKQKIDKVKPTVNELTGELPNKEELKEKINEVKNNTIKNVNDIVDKVIDVDGVKIAIKGNLRESNVGIKNIFGKFIEFSKTTADRGKQEFDKIRNKISEFIKNNDFEGLFNKILDDVPLPKTTREAKKVYTKVLMELDPTGELVRKLNEKFTNPTEFMYKLHKGIIAKKQERLLKDDEGSLTQSIKGKVNDFFNKNLFTRSLKRFGNVGKRLVNLGVGNIKVIKDSYLEHLKDPETGKVKLSLKGLTKGTGSAFVNTAKFTGKEVRGIYGEIFDEVKDIAKTAIKKAKKEVDKADTVSLDEIENKEKKKGIIGKLTSGFIDSAKFTGEKYKESIDKTTELIKDVRNKLRKDDKEENKIIKEIAEEKKYIKEIKDKSIKSKKKKINPFDEDGDGIRDGSWREILKKDKKEKESKKTSVIQKIKNVASKIKEKTGIGFGTIAMIASGLLMSMGITKDDIKDFVKGTVNTLKFVGKTLKSIWEFIRPVLGKIADGIGAAWNFLKKAFNYIKYLPSNISYYLRKVLSHIPGLGSLAPTKEEKKIHQLQMQGLSDEEIDRILHPDKYKNQPTKDETDNNESRGEIAGEVATSGALLYGAKKVGLTKVVSATVGGTKKIVKKIAKKVLTKTTEEVAAKVAEKTTAKVAEDAIAKKVSKTGLKLFLNKIKTIILEKFGPRLATKLLGKIALRFVPFAGAAMLAWDAAKIGYYMIHDHMPFKDAVSKQILGIDIFANEVPKDENGEPINPGVNPKAKEKAEKLAKKWIKTSNTKNKVINHDDYYSKVVSKQFNRTHNLSNVVNENTDTTKSKIKQTTDKIKGYKTAKVPVWTSEGRRKYEMLYGIDPVLNGISPTDPTAKEMIKYVTKQVPLDNGDVTNDKIRQSLQNKIVDKAKLVENKNNVEVKGAILKSTAYAANVNDKHMNELKQHAAKSVQLQEKMLYVLNNMLYLQKQQTKALNHITKNGIKSKVEVINDKPSSAYHQFHEPPTNAAVAAAAYSF